MNVTVHLFAHAKELAGQSKIEVSVEDGANLDSLRQAICFQFPSLETVVVRSVFSLNQEFATGSASIQPTDEIALIPPVSGG